MFGLLIQTKHCCFDCQISKSNEMFDLFNVAVDVLARNWSNEKLTSHFWLKQSYKASHLIFIQINLNTEMTAHLWKKEQNGDKLLYVDLFNSLDSSYFSKLDKQLEALETKHSNILEKCNVKSSAFMHEAIQFYQESAHYRAIEAYTSALRFAEIGTESIPMAFMSRADCFYQLKLIDQALIDVELAIESGCTENELPQLKKLQDIYMQKKMSIEPNQSFEEPMRKLDFEADKHFPCLANVLAIRSNNQFGRHIAAKCDIDVGQNVLMEESFASVNRSIDHVCYTCLAESINFIPCPKCTDVVFCNQKCMESNEVHKLDCQTMFHRMPHKVQFIIRTILMAVTAFPDIDSLMAFVEDSISDDDLPDSVSDSQSKYRLYLKLKRSVLNENAILDVCDLFKLSMTVSTIREMFNTKRKQRFLVHLLLHHLAVNVNNGYFYFRSIALLE